MINSINCYGIIPLQFLENSWNVFLIKHFNGGHWGFPKGHRKKGETPKKTAERELKEETGMEVIKYLKTSHLKETYQYVKKEHLIKKTVRFYLAFVTPNYSLQKEEVICGNWMPIKNILSYVTFEEEKYLYISLINKINNI